MSARVYRVFLCDEGWAVEHDYIRVRYATREAALEAATIAARYDGDRGNLAEVAMQGSTGRWQIVSTYQQAGAHIAVCRERVVRLTTLPNRRESRFVAYDPCRVCFCVFDRASAADELFR